MSLLEVDLSLLFVVAVVLIWFMIAYQFVLTVFGYINYLKSLKEKRRIDGKNIEYPTCAILIPAHNEEKVMSTTLDAMLQLKYPSEKLEIIVIDDASTDRTAEIVRQYAAQDRRVKLFQVPQGEGGKGKSRALNLGVRQTKADVIAIYDADNMPTPETLHYLVVNLLEDTTLGAVLGKFRTVNKDHNILTKFINIETLSFQSILQAGRWQMHNIATLPGTNYVIWRHLLEKLNGWDEEALTEDSEMSIRLYLQGYKIKFIPYAITYEQEPQLWNVWVRQRTRWVRGNNYVVGKFFKKIPSFPNKRLAFDLLYTLSLYYVFFIALIISDSLFAVSALNLVSISLPGPYTTVWILAIVLFLLEILLAISYDEEDTWHNVGVLMLMYLLYCQLWIYVVLKALWADYVKKERRVWAKTVRFEVETPNSTG